MKLPDSVPMESGSFLTIRDQWRTEWEVGVQVCAVLLLVKRYGRGLSRGRVNCEYKARLMLNYLSVCVFTRSCCSQLSLTATWLSVVIIQEGCFSEVLETTHG